MFQESYSDSRKKHRSSVLAQPMLNFSSTKRKESWRSSENYVYHILRAEKSIILLPSMMKREKVCRSTTKIGGGRKCMVKRETVWHTRDQEIDVKNLEMNYEHYTCF